MEQVFSKLQENFGLNSKHLLILNVLQHQNLTAKLICSKTKIPQGRIYDYLNHLIENKIIEKTPKKPFLYSMHNLNHSIVSFMKHKVENVLKSQTEVMNMIEGAGIEHIEIVNSTMNYTQTHLNMISEARSFKYVSLHGSFPYLMYPLEYNKFLKLRKAVVESRPTITFFDNQTAFLVFKTYLDALEKGKEIKVVFDKKSFDFHVKLIKKMGEKFFEEWKSAVIKQFDKYNMQAFVINEYLPMQIDVNDRRVDLSFRHMEVMNGIVILSKEVSKFYEQIFEQNCKRATNVLPLIKKLKF